jgi:hypothetical protein
MHKSIRRERAGGLDQLEKLEARSWKLEAGRQELEVGARSRG